MLFSALDAVVTSATAWVKIRVIFFRIPLFRELAHQFFRIPTAYATISNSLATCQRLQFSVHACMLMHVTACWGCTNTIRVLTRRQLWEWQLSWLIIRSGSQLMQVQLPSAERDFSLSSRVDLECAVFSWVQTMVWLPALAILNACLDVNACDCMLGLYEHNKSLNSLSTLGEKSLAALGCRICISSDPNLIIILSTSWSTFPPRHMIWNVKLQASLTVAGPSAALSC